MFVVRRTDTLHIHTMEYHPAEKMNEQWRHCVNMCTSHKHVPPVIKQVAKCKKNNINTMFSTRQNQESSYLGERKKENGIRGYTEGPNSVCDVLFLKLRNG